MTASDTITRFSSLLSSATSEEIEAMALVSPAVHFACYVTIRDKNNAIISPVPNILQLRMSEAFETLRDLGVKVRIIVVKPRQVGCSSFASHILYHHGMRRPIEGISISDVKGHSMEIMDKLRSYSTNDSYPWGTKIVQDSTSELTWSNGTHWTVDSAENPNAGVGGTRQAGHFSEVAKWPQTTTRNDKKTMSAVLPSLSGNDSVGFAESTPEGAFGWMFETYEVAVSLEEFLANWRRGIRPAEQWVKVFAAWHEFQEHAKEVTKEEREMINATLTEDEQKGISEFGWTAEQIAWRRETIATVCNGDPKTFAYYYPSDDKSCWLASGSPRFDQQALAEMLDASRSAPVEFGHLVTQDSGKTVFIGTQDGSGDILLWERPQEGLRYLVTCDPASDASQTISADPDRHSVSVWRAAYTEVKPTGEQVHRPAAKVARLRPPFYGDGDVVAGHIVRLSKFYGNAITAIEINCGLDIMRQCKVAGVPLYKRRPLSHRTGEVVEQYGFRMGDKQERNALIEGFAAAIRERAINVRCQHSIDEYKAFVIKPNGRAEAALGRHDDDVMADAIAWEVLPSASEYRRTVAPSPQPPDRHSWRRVNVSGRGW